MRKHNPRHLRVWIPEPQSVDELGVIGKEDSMMNIPIFWRALRYLVLLAALTFATVLFTVAWSRGTALEEFGLGKASSIWNSASSDVNMTYGQDELPAGVHPIEYLMIIATKHFEKMKKNEIHTLEQAAAQYRKLRGRHPPPGFDTWYKYANTHNAIINEKFWDQIYHDLAPFWSLEPVVLRKQANVFSPKISIRNGKVEAKSPNTYPKLVLFRDMFTTLNNDPHVRLPDIDIPLNINDESAMLIPWETIDTLLSTSRKMMLPPSSIISNSSSLGGMESLTKDYGWKPEWLGPRRTHPGSHLGPRPMWSLIRPACPPNSEARLGKVYNDIWDPEGETKEEHEAAALLPRTLPGWGLRGYVSNWTNGVDACQYSHLQGLHSAFVSPKNMNVATKLFPLFSDVKFGMGNEILLPSTVEWNYSSPVLTPIPWDDRESKLYWRGRSTSAYDTARYWRHFQRERLLSMVNATHVEIAEAATHTGNESTVGVGYARNFRLFPGNEFHLRTQTGGKLAEWVNAWADVGFTTLECTGQNGCDEYISLTDPDADIEAKAKFAIVVDDDELIDHMRSEKVTLRSSVYRQWYDSRLVPWLHFIPLDNTLIDIYGVMEFFLGSHVDAHGNDYPHAVGEVQKHEHNFKTPENINDAPFSEEQSKHGRNEHHIRITKRATHDNTARRVAEAGREWADKVLRKEDVLIYVYRLILEYARVVDDRRDRMGWVGDLMKEG